MTRNFPPLIGGMERLNRHLLEALLPKGRVALCGPAGASGCVPDGVEVYETAIRPLPLFLLITLIKAVFVAIRRRPMWVMAGSGLTAPIAWLAARCCGAKMVVYLHGLDLVVAHPVYQSCWIPIIRKADLLLANSKHTSVLAQAHGVAGNRVHVLNPGTGLPELDGRAAIAFRERFNLGSRPVLLSVGRLTRRKGLADFVKEALPRIVAARPDVVLLIIGGDAVDALHGSGHTEKGRILRAVRQAKMEQHLRFAGHCDDDTLQAAYQACDVHVFPVLNLPDDVEGFGMVALEAAAHGLATVAFGVGGVPDAIADGQTGALVREGDYEKFADAVISQLAQAHAPTQVATCRAFAKQKAWPAFAERLRATLEGHGHVPPVGSP